MNTQPPDPSQAELEDQLETLAAHHQRVVITPRFIGELTELITTWAERSAKRRELEARRDTISDMTIECHNERRRLEAKLKALEEKK